MKYGIRLAAATLEKSGAGIATAAALAAQMIAGENKPGPWLVSFDVDAHDGMGDATFSDDPARAMPFESREAAGEAWRTQSRVRPLRSDQRPNRPLTAFSVAIEPLPEV